MADEARGEQRRNQGRGHDDQTGEQQQGAAQYTGNPVHQPLYRRVATRFPVLCQHRHKSLCEGAFGKQPAQEIGNLEGDKKGVGVGARAHETGQDDVPHQAQYAGGHGHATHQQAGPEQLAPGCRRAL